MSETKVTTMYLARTYLCEPRLIPVKATRATDKSVWILEEEWLGKKRESRRARHSRGEHYFDTWAEAREHVLDFARKRVHRLRSDLAKAERSLSELQEMQEPHQ